MQISFVYEKEKKKRKKERETGVISLRYTQTSTGKILASKVHFHLTAKALKSAKVIHIQAVKQTFSTVRKTERTTERVLDSLSWMSPHQEDTLSWKRC